MKNVHLLSTDKPTMLAGLEYIINDQGIDKRVFKLKLCDKLIPNKDLKDVGYIPQHIYITSSDEQIKEGDYIFCSKTNNIFKADSIEYLESHNIIEDFNKSFYINSKHAKKITLTTDQDLIKEGVQAIDDTFLQWFVKNPSCEFVEVENQYRVKSGTIQEHIDGIAGYEYYEYKIIIPQEESKLINNCPKCGLDLIEREGSTPVCHRVDCGGIILSNETLREWALKKESKQETVEEAANIFSNGFQLHLKIDNVKSLREGFIAGAKWQAERRYSEEEVIEFLNKREDYINSEDNIFDYKSIKEWFKQFKKKQ